MFVVRSTNLVRGFKPPHRKTLIAATVTLAVAITGTVGWGVYKQEQQEKIQQAATLLSTACTSDFTANPQALSAARTQISQAKQLLSQIPASPVFGEPTAQNYLTDSAKCLQDLQDTQNFFAAQTLSQSAAAFDGGTILSVSEWRSLQGHLEQAIALLKPIASDSRIYPKVEEALVLNQAQLAEVQKRMQYEQEAVNALAQAEAVQLEAENILQGASAPDQFSAAAAQMQKAIGLLKTITPGHRVSEESQRRLAVYQDQLASIQSRQAVSQLHQLIEQAQAFARSTDTLNIQSEQDFVTYTSGIHDLQDQFDRLIEQSGFLADNPAAQSLGAALTRYHDVSELWRQCQAGQCSDPYRSAVNLQWGWWVPESYQLEGDSQSLAAKYDLQPSSEWLGKKYLRVDAAMTAVWQQADHRIQAAKQQLQENE